MPYHIKEPASLSPQSRYGYIGSVSYVDKDGKGWPVRQIGGQIGTGKGGQIPWTVWRVLRWPEKENVDADLGFNKTVDEYLTLLMSYFVRDPVTKEQTIYAGKSVSKIYKDAKILDPTDADASKNMISKLDEIFVRFGFRNEAYLNKFFDLTLWTVVIDKWYEGYAFDPKGIDETYYGFGFTGRIAKGDHGGKLGRSIKFANSEIEGYFTPPTKSLINVARYRKNMVKWIALCRHLLGMKAAGAVMLFTFLNDNYGSIGSKDISFTTLIDNLASDGNSPFGLDETVTVNEEVWIKYTLVKMFLLKAWQFIKESVSTDDLRFDIYCKLLPKQTDATAFLNYLSAKTTNYEKTQLKQVISSMPSKVQLNLLPFTIIKTNLSNLYRKFTKTGLYEEACFAQNSYGDQPAVDICELDYDDIDAVTVDFVIIMPMHEDATGESTIAWNRLTNEFDGNLQDSNRETVAGFANVYPAYLKRAKPHRMGSSLNREFWPLVMEYAINAKAIHVVPSLVDVMLSGQKSIYGPNSYLSNVQFGTGNNSLWKYADVTKIGKAATHVVSVWLQKNALHLEAPSDVKATTEAELETTANKADEELKTALKEAVPADILPLFNGVE